MAVRPPETVQAEDFACDEESIVVELACLGVSYLSRQAAVPSSTNTPPLDRADLIAALVCQPSARVRAATISLFLAQPSSWRSVERALSQLKPKQRLSLSLFYSAAVQLQRQHESELRRRLDSDWETLPDLFADDLGLSAASSAESRLTEIARVHRSRTGRGLNWEGSYRQAADRLLRQWALEAQWSR